MSSAGGDQAQAERVARARRKAEARQGFWWDLGFYVAVNAFLAGVWFFNGRGLFWPIFVIFGWGIGLAANYYVAYVQSDRTWVDRETEKILAEEKGGAT